MTASEAALRAARLDDEVSHGFGLLGMVAGALLGAALGALIIAGTCATGGALAAIIVVAVGGGAAAGGLGAGLLVRGIMKAANLSGPTTGTLAAGSPNVTINGRPAMRAGVDVASSCNGLYGINHVRHREVRIAEGSRTVTVNGQPMARVSMKLECGARIRTGAADVLVGGPTARVVTVWDAEEWVEKGLEVLGLIAFLTAGGIAFAGGAAAFAGFVLVTGGINAGMGALHQWGESLGPGYGDILEGAGTLALLGMGSMERVRSLAGLEFQVGEPVNPVTGDYFDQRTDLHLPGVLPLTLLRTYAGKDRLEGLLGPKWICNWSQRLVFSQDQASVILEDAVGEHLKFVLPPGESFLESHRLAPYYRLAGTRSRARLFDARSQQVMAFEREEGGPPVGRLTSIEDRNGNRIAFHYEGGHLRQVTRSDGAALRVETTPEGFITAVILEGEDEPCLRYAYNGRGELIDARSAAGGVFHYAYTPEGLLNHWRDSGVTQVDLEYDTAGRVIATRTPGGLYNDHLAYFPGEGRTVYTDATGAATTFWYGRNNLVTRKEDALGHAVQYEWDGLERLRSITDPLGRETVCEYDEAGRLAARTDWAGRTTGCQYDRMGLLTLIQHPDGRCTAWEYDARGNLTGVTEADGTRLRHACDEQGRRISTTGPDGAVLRFEYDAQGRPSAWTDPLGHRTTLEVAAWGSLRAQIDPEGRTTRFRYDAGTGNPRGRLSSVHALDRGVERFEYDAEGQLAAHAGAEGQTTRYRHGAFDLLEHVTDPAGHTTKLAYDGAARLERITNAAGQTWTYAYDAAGRVAAETDWAGRRTAYIRDPLGRAVRRRLADGSVQSLVWDERDRIASVVSRTGRIAYEYDDGDRLVRATTWTAPDHPDTDLRFIYDAHGRLMEERQDGSAIRYEYDAAGRCISRTSPGGEIRLAYDSCGGLASYDSNGHPLSFSRNALGQETARWSGPEAFTLRQRYDPCGRLSHQSAGRSMEQVDFLPEAHRQAPVLEAQSEIRRRYEWDRSGRLVGMRDSERGQRSFTYDPRDQVTRVLCPERHLDEQYRYNALMDLTQSSGRPHRYEAGEVQYVGDTTYRRDIRGRVTSKTAIRNGFRPQTWTYRWDDFDRLVETDTPEGETWRYTYDAFGRRTRKACITKGRERTIRYLWQGATLIEELRETEAVTFRWHFEPGTFRPLAKEVQAKEGQSFYPIVTDHLGTPKELFDESGECLWKADHSLWGKTETHVLRMKARISWTNQGNPSSPLECNLRFQNQWEDQETGLCYNLHRYYDPESGQYLSQDPIKLAGGIRTHGYVADPLSLVDPLGLCPKGGAPNTGIAESVWHATGNPRAAQGVLDGIDPKFLNPNSRFGAAFHVAEEPGTALAEMAHHGVDSSTGIRFALDRNAMKVLDLTNPDVSATWGYRGGPISSTTQALGSQARQQGFNVIRYFSERAPAGTNLAILDNYNQILKPVMVTPVKP